MAKKYIIPFISSVLCLLFCSQFSLAQSYTITTIAGNGTAGFSGDGSAATAAELSAPSSVYSDANGNIYIGDAANNRTRKVSNTGIISTYAGTGTAGFAGDGNAASSAELNNPINVGADYAGNIYTADEYNQRVRKIDVLGNIYTYAGNGHVAFSGDGGQATAAQMFFPISVAKDASGNIYVTDCLNQRIRKVNTNGIITTFAGNGVNGFSGDGGQATAAELSFPNGITTDATGNIYFADNNNNRIRKINTNGVISTIVGTGFGWYGGDGAAATAAWINNPTDVTMDGTGNMYIADKNNSRIRMVNTNGIISTYTGNGTAGYSGDGGAATAAEINHPWGVAIGSSGNLYITDNNNNRIRIVSTGIINTYAGNGTAGYSGDGGAATAAEINNPYGISVDASNNVYISDASNNRIREIANTGIISTFGGNGTGGFAGDGGQATAAEISNPVGACMDASGNLYFIDQYNQRLRVIKTTGIITTVAGNGVLAFSGDGRQADSAQLFFPTSIAFDFNGNGYISDCFNQRIRKVNGSNIITTIAGNGTNAYSGDGGQATAAELNFPIDAVADALGNIYIADAGNHRIRKINTNGVISTFAGNGIWGYAGDGGQATAARLNDPTGVATDGFDNVFIADKNNGVIRKVNSSGIITTVAGNGTQGFSGDGGPATSAQLNNPWSIYVDLSGAIYIADYSNNRIRKLTPSCSITVSTTTTALTCIGGNNATATATCSGGTPPYTFLWSNGQTSATATGLRAGIYTCNAHDANSCTGSAVVTIAQPPYIISTVAGQFTSGYSGDGGQATASKLTLPYGVAVDAPGNIYIGDFGNNAIRKINTNGVITTIAGGNGTPGYSGDGGPAISADLNNPSGVWVDASGNILFTDESNARVRKINTNGIITTIAGDGPHVYGCCADAGQATADSISLPSAVITDAAGNFYFSDPANGAIRKVDPSGNISRFAGFDTNQVPVYGFSGDGGPASVAELEQPNGLAIDQAGNIYIADTPGNRIRKVNTSGIISTYAGDGYGATASGGFFGDGGPATAAELYQPLSVATDNAGNVYIGDHNNRRLRMVNTNGIITSIAGNGVAGYSGDGGYAKNAEMAVLSGVAVDASSNIFIADNFTNVVRELHACKYCGLQVHDSLITAASCSGNGSAKAITFEGIGAFSYSWAPTGGNSQIASLSAGTYTTTVTDSIGCTATASIALTSSSVTAAISGPDSVCHGDAVTLTASGGTSYLWSDGSTNATLTTSSLNADSTYSVTVSNGPCNGMATKIVYVGASESLCAIKFYNGITPNGDGFNDYWQIDNIQQFPDNSVQIFNRWGSVVWSGNGYDNNKVVWRGMDNRNEPLPDGTYYYLVKTGNRSFKGWVELTR